MWQSVPPVNSTNTPVNVEVEQLSCLIVVYIANFFASGEAQIKYKKA